ncbi:toll/interleukin-1 receptor domain-containing protein [Shewanella sp. Isolate13]|uniref:toll/interleukin-1 receptor domain-containing protein n=1 Tax=Shewanella sp. Isolate13 TaxID=2908531 RepID=UPI001EFCCA1D|nr:toll/interleukin-1 receptor domain-containing protein [Shewanella sp. Isolate13]MCG9728849.1 toll/interleukin-1 receptor domain-containing protein [Shewanella sp. Isolate13]
MSDLCKNAVAFLQKRFPVASVLNHESIFSDAHGNEALRIWPMIAQDSQSGMKQRAIAIESLGSKGEIYAVAQSMDKIFSELDSSVYVRIGNSLKPTGHEIDTNQMVFAPRVVLYTNKLCIPRETVIQAFNSVKTLIDIVDESEMHKTLFISYGGPDEPAVTEINKKIKSKGIKTWFFPDDANPGDKLHRMMHDGVNNHDRVLLVCSKESLTRPGVLNEIERVLEREAKEGGTEILIPITLDDFVYGDWAPSRGDIAEQIRSRVIIKLEIGSDQIGSSIEKLAKVLK